MAELGDSGWVGIGEACRFLGESAYVIRGLERSGRVRVRLTPGRERGKLYSLEDLAAVREANETPVPLLRDEETIDWHGHVPDWTHQRFFERLRSCWLFLMSHGYLRKSESQDLMARIEADETTASLRVEWQGEHQVRTGAGVSEVWVKSERGGLELRARFFADDHYQWAVFAARTNFRYDLEDDDPEEHER